MKRYYTFLLQGSWRTKDIVAHTLKQAYHQAVKEHGDKVIKQYATSPIGRSTFSDWKHF
jgi:AAA+ superfamily predicted ATPase